MRQDNLLQERMYHIVIKEQRSFSCSVFAIRVLTLPNQTKVNSAEPKLPVLISSYIQICTYTPFLEDFNSDKHAHFAEDFQMLFTNANFLQIINCLFSVQKPLYTVQY